MQQKEMINKIENMSDDELYKFIEFLLSESPEFVECIAKELEE